MFLSPDGRLVATPDELMLLFDQYIDSQRKKGILGWFQYSAKQIKDQNLLLYIEGLVRWAKSMGWIRMEPDEHFVFFTSLAYFHTGYSSSDFEVPGSGPFPLVFYYDESKAKK